VKRDCPIDARRKRAGRAEQNKAITGAGMKTKADQPP